MADEDPEEIFEEFDVETLEDMPENTIVKPEVSHITSGSALMCFLDPQIYRDISPIENTALF